MPTNLNVNNPLNKETGRKVWFEQNSQYRKNKEKGFRDFIKEKYETSFKNISFAVPILTFFKTQTVLALFSVFILFSVVTVGACELIAPPSLKPSRLTNLISPTPTILNPNDNTNQQNIDPNYENISSVRSASSLSESPKKLEPDSENNVMNLEKCGITVKYPKKYTLKYDDTNIDPYTKGSKVIIYSFIETKRYITCQFFNEAYFNSGFEEDRANSCNIADIFDYKNVFPYSNADLKKYRVCTSGNEVENGYDFVYMSKKISFEGSRSSKLKFNDIQIEFNSVALRSNP
jgi:hypothetical protein